MNEIKNMAASIRAKLLNLAKKERINFDQVLLLYLQERLLYRLSKSQYRDNFYLKGGLLILSITNFKTRPTKDADFLARHISNNLDEVRDILKKICSIKVNDGVTFDTDSITVEKITEDADYQGIRLKITGFLGNARKRLQLDIGFSDIIVPKHTTLEYPTLADQERPNINAYSIESVIAEKFEAMLRFSFVNSRMKDFYDLFIISETADFDGRILQEAVSTTLQKRGTPLVKKPAVFKTKFSQDKQRSQMWKRYLRRIGKEPVSFLKVMNRIAQFISPVYERILQEEEFFKSWDKDMKAWIGQNGVKDC